MKSYKTLDNLISELKKIKNEKVQNLANMIDSEAKNTIQEYKRKLFLKNKLNKIGDLDNDNTIVSITDIQELGLLGLKSRQAITNAIFNTKYFKPINTSNAKGVKRWAVSLGEIRNYIESKRVKN